MRSVEVQQAGAKLTMALIEIEKEYDLTIAEATMILSLEIASWAKCQIKLDREERS